MIAGALTIALSYINRVITEYTESMSGAPMNLADQSNTQTSTNPTIEGGGNAVSNTLQARILLVTLSPSTDLAHQYIPIMNSIFACQRLSIPIDVLQLPLPSPGATSSIAAAAAAPSQAATATSPNQNSTVFLQQAADATHGIYIPAQLTPPSSNTVSTTFAQSSLLTYLLPHLLAPPSLRPHLILPTRIDVDFRAACFCHRSVISIGFVCSICLSIFCQDGCAEILENNDGMCLTCGSKLEVPKGQAGYGSRPVVVARRKKKRRKVGEGTAVETPTPG